MTELETLKRAKMYIDKMANGINPLTDESIDENDFVNNVRIARCLFYVSGVLEKVIENDGEVAPVKARKASFNIDPSDLERFNYSEYPIALSVIAQRMNELVDTSKMKKLTYNTLATGLIEQGVLEVIIDENEKSKKVPTQKGRDIGLSIVQKEGQSGNIYDVVVYNIAAQRFIVDNISDLFK